MSREELSHRVRQRARDEGFDLVGIAAADRADHADSLGVWLQRGRHGEMAYMADTAAQREDVRRLLPECHSVIAVAMSYRTSHPDSRSAATAGRAWVSRYAWGRDYHRILKKGLVRLGRWLHEQQPDSRWRAAVDTAPVLERSWAAAAGLGWIGKSTQLINRDLGSELFLGVLLTSVELVPDIPTTHHCGRCTACLDACPTGAIVEPFALDARRCIAYLTIEHRGEIEPVLGSRLGHHIAGCDICQEVCPWTRRAPTDLHDCFQPEAHRFHPRLNDLESLDEQGYRAWRQASPLNRIPHNQMRRNIDLVKGSAHTEPERGKSGK